MLNSKSDDFDCPYPLFVVMFFGILEGQIEEVGVYLSSFDTESMILMLFLCFLLFLCTHSVDCWDARLRAHEDWGLNQDSGIHERSGDDDSCCWPSCWTPAIQCWVHDGSKYSTVLRYAASWRMKGLRSHILSLTQQLWKLPLQRVGITNRPIDDTGRMLFNEKKLQLENCRAQRSNLVCFSFLFVFSCCSVACTLRVVHGRADGVSGIWRRLQWTNSLPCLSEI